CPVMLAIASQRAAALGVAPRFHGVLASVEAIPFADETFHRAAAAFTIRNVAKLDVALREIRRVLRPAGRVVILELHTPEGAVPRAIYRAYARVFPPLAGALGCDPDAYRYVPTSIEALADPDDFTRRLKACGFWLARTVQLA